MPAQVELINISKSYKNKHFTVKAVQNVNLTVEYSETTVISGPSGCGKTTLLKIIAGQTYPDAGRLRIMDVEIYGLEKHEREKFMRYAVGYMPQEDRLIPTLTIGENVSLPLVARGEKKHEIVRKVKEKLSLFDIENLYSRYPNETSLGERKRALLARALITEPPVLLLDEPTANLDSDNIDKLLSYISELVKDMGITAIVTTHDNRVFRIARKLLLMLDGRLFPQG